MLGSSFEPREFPGWWVELGMVGRRSCRSHLLQGWVVTGHSDLGLAPPQVNAFTTFSWLGPHSTALRGGQVLASAADEETEAQRFPH